MGTWRRQDTWAHGGDKQETKRRLEGHMLETRWKHGIEVKTLRRHGGHMKEKGMRHEEDMNIEGNMQEVLRRHVRDIKET